MNIFHGIRVPMPCKTNVKRIKLNRSRGGFISSFARSMVIPIIYKIGTSTIRNSLDLTLIYKYTNFIVSFKFRRKLNKFQIDLPLKFNSSFGKLLASHAGVSRTGLAKNGAFSTSLPPSVKRPQKNWIMAFEEMTLRKV